MHPLNIIKSSEPLELLYVGLEQELMANIANQLARHSYITDTAKWQIQCLAELGKLNKANIKTISQKVGVAPEMMRVAVENAAFETASELEPRFKEFALNGITNQQYESFLTPRMEQTLSAYQKQATSALNLVNTTMQIKAKDAYTKIVNSVAADLNRQEYLDTLNLAAGKVAVGAESYQQAVRKAIIDFNEKGIAAFVDKAGRNWSPEAYVNNVVRTTVSNTANQVQFGFFDQYGCDLIQVSQHMGARPKCALDQGRIFSLSGTHPTYPAWSTSSYGQPDGILGCNCRHSVFAFFEGLSVDSGNPIDQAENDRVYQLTQKQRQLERKVRKDKTECTLLNRVGDTAGFEKSSVKLKRHEAALKQFVGAHRELTYQGHRSQVVGFDRSVSQKAVVSSKRHFNEYNAWLESIGAKAGVQSNLSSYYNFKKNNPYEYTLLQRYTKSVKANQIHPFVGFDQFKQMDSDITSKLHGLVTTNGVEIKGHSIHMIERVLGTHNGVNEPYTDALKGLLHHKAVTLDEIKTTITTAKKISVPKYNAKGEPSIRLTGKNCYVTINPDKQQLIQVTARGKKRSDFMDWLVADLSEDGKKLFQKYMNGSVSSYTDLDTLLEELDDKLTEIGFVNQDYLNETGIKLQRLYDTIVMIADYRN